MKRKDFIKKVILTGVVSAIAPKVLKASNTIQSKSTYDKLMQQVGFNHLPNKKIHTMNSIIHKAETRGKANHGWLNSHHSFSFANYYNPDRMNFGVLRVLNDDVVKEGMGFGTHPHDNMEIISIPLEGDLVHKDSLGNIGVIKEGDVQAMSAGTGISHSEYNNNKDRDVKFLQIWIFPREKQVKPRYDQVSIRDLKKENEFYQVLSPNKSDQGVWINQDAWMNIGNFKKGNSDQYKIQKDGNGVYIFILEGEVEINGEQLNKRDGIGIWNTDTVNLKATENARVLLMDVPMHL